MQKKYFLLLLIGSVILCGCDKQTKINTAKIDALSQKLVVLQQIQARQLADIQSQLTALTPTLDKMSGSYFEKSHEDAIFFHTNTLYLLLLVDRKIEAELHAAANERQAEHALAYSSQTNLMNAMYRCTALIQDEMAAQEGRLETNINAGIQRIGATMSEELARQNKLLAPDAAETARRSQLAADVAQMKRDIEQIKAQLQTTNLPAIRP
jgi:hypothetical protein